MTAPSRPPQPPATEVPHSALDKLRAFPELQQAADDAAQPQSDADTARHGRHLAALALVYLRHADPARAMVLGLAAMAMGDLRAGTVLLVAESLLRAGDPRQALAVLSRFDDPHSQLATDPSAVQLAARHYLEARVHNRLGDDTRARAALDLALAGPAPDTAGDAP